MSLPMKGLLKVKTDLAELNRKFRMFSVRCDFAGAQDVGRKRRVRCCNSESYDYQSYPALLCMFDCCPVVHERKE